MRVTIGAALEYAQYGWKIFPLHTIRDTALCSCGRTACDSPGKHPRTLHGVKDATDDEATLTRWWGQWPDSNIGLATGGCSGVFALDVDPRHGGDVALEALQLTYTPLPHTLLQQTGGGGQHYLFTYTQPIGNSTAKLGLGLDIRGDGGYIVLAPSTHISGREYCWEDGADPEECRPVPAPAWLFALLGTAQTSGPAVAPDAPIPQGSRESTLMSIGGAARRRGASPAALAALLTTENTRCTPPLAPQDLDRLIRSLTKYAPTESPAGHASPNGATPPLTRATLADRLFMTGGSKGKPPRILECLPNIVMILTHDPRLYGLFGFNAFTERSMVLRRPPWGKEGAQPWEPTGVEDWHEIQAVQWLADTYDLPRVSPKMVHDAILSVAHDAPYHPVRQYLEGLMWDGTLRLDAWMSTYLSVEPTPYVSAVGQCTLIAAVARILAPGCQCDNVTILEGKQGIGKSSAWRILAGDEWFSDSMPDMHSKDAMESLAGKWIIELGELASLRRSEIEAVKRFISAREDHYRPSYGRNAQTFKRQCLFVGSTNEGQYLRDGTGNRRYWPVTLRSTVQADALWRIRDQLWAEAVHAFTRHVPWHLTEPLEAAATDVQGERLEVDPWEELLTKHLPLTQGSLLTTAEIFSEHLEVKKEHQSVGEARRLGSILRKLGWVYITRRDGARVTRCWRLE